MFYAAPPPSETLSQGDIIDECPILFWEPGVSGLTPATAHARVVVLTQACDLAQARAHRVLVALVHDAQHLVERRILKAGLVCDHLRNHRVYGWYFLPAGDGINESVVDLRDLHTIPRSMLEQLVREGRRPCHIQTPYREHLAQHFATTYSRIGLPLPYETQASL